MRDLEVYAALSSVSQDVARPNGRASVHPLACSPCINVVHTNCLLCTEKVRAELRAGPVNRVVYVWNGIQQGAVAELHPLAAWVALHTHLAMPLGCCGKLTASCCNILVCVRVWGMEGVGWIRAAAAASHPPPVSCSVF
jgi:hypothetical protein